MALVQHTGTILQLLEELQTELTPFSSHLFEAKWQQTQFVSIRTCPPPSAVVAVMDFAENYVCVTQNKVQSAHWYQTNITLHPFVTYYTCSDPSCADSSTVREAVVIITADNNHDHHAVNHFTTLVADHLHNRDPAAERFIQYSDGCAAQYKCMTSFTDISFGLPACPSEPLSAIILAADMEKNPVTGKEESLKIAYPEL